jgi:nicotinate-nucleotide adenylyltransferase
VQSGGEARTALFGGTFDPVHNTHLAIARAAADRLCLRKVLFMPAANPPHKIAGTIAQYEDRVAMLRLACAGDPRFEVSRIEEPPPGENRARSYSIVTIEKLLAEGCAPLSFLLGADAFAEIRTWHRWREVVALVEFIVVTRPGAIYEKPHEAVVRELDGLDSPVSSSGVRASLLRGDWNVQVPEPVLQYIQQRGIYQSHADVSSADR